MKNAINWFEIPAKDFDRAKTFYSNVLNVEITEMPSPDMRYAMLPADMENGGVGGGIVQAEGYEPGTNGPLVYLNGGDDLSVALARVEAAGGKVTMPKTSLGPNGFMARFTDTEGNSMAFHSMS